MNEVLEGDESCAMILLKSSITYEFPPYFPLAISARFAPDFSAATWTEDNPIKRHPPKQVVFSGMHSWRNRHIRRWLGRQDMTISEYAIANIRDVPRNMILSSLWLDTRENVPSTYRWTGQRVRPSRYYRWYCQHRATGCSEVDAPRRSCTQTREEASNLQTLMPNANITADSGRT